ncbi:MAG: hypothetical protein HND52_05315 [Ignavibacteriae bacterium]|nr:hypothetical protein [Ignavibacteriota bacterium]
MIEIKKINSFENDYESVGFSKTDLKKAKFNTKFLVHIDPEKSLIIIECMIRFYLIRDEKEYDLSGLRVANLFKIKNFKKTFNYQQDNKIDIPKEILATFLNICIGGARGMLTMLHTNPDYKEYILPLVNHHKIADSIITSAKSKDRTSTK